jgi:hypothetical protein
MGEVVLQIRAEEEGKGQRGMVEVSMDQGRREASRGEWRSGSLEEEGGLRVGAREVEE